MKKIRIGNDIRFAVDLGQYIQGDHVREREAYYPNSTTFEQNDNNPFVDWVEVYYNGRSTTNPSDFTLTGTPVCIRGVKAILVNTTLREAYANMRKKSRFVSRFPIEPYMEAFTSTPYDICNSGYPTWRAFPRQYASMPWKGFGVYPNWDNIYKRLPARNEIEYNAAVAATDKQNVVEVLFPAKDQLHVGKYSMIIVAKLYAPGYNKENVKTVTVDIPDVFELVKTSDEGSDTGIEVNTEYIVDVLPSGYDPEYVDDIYVNEGSIDSNGYLTLTRTDNSTVDINLNSAVGWYDNLD